MNELSREDKAELHAAIANITNRLERAWPHLSADEKKWLTESCIMIESCDVEIRMTMGPDEEKLGQMSCVRCRVRPVQEEKELIRPQLIREQIFNNDSDESESEDEKDEFIYNSEPCQFQFEIGECIHRFSSIQAVPPEIRERIRNEDPDLYARAGGR